jgi:hypothetical protein
MIPWNIPSLMPPTVILCINCTNAARNRLEVVGIGHLAKVGPEGGQHWSVHAMGASVPSLARLESVFVWRFLLIFWTWPMACIHGVGLVWSRYGLPLHLFGLGFFLCLGLFLFPLNGSVFTLSRLRIVILFICILDMCPVNAQLTKTHGIR